MANVVREGVEGIGISPSFPILCPVDSYFTQVAIPETIRIPDVKPEMEELLSVMVDSKIVSLRIINTPIGTSQEGQTLTGKKLSIELELKQKVKYIANEPTQSVHAAHYENKVSSIWIVVPEKVCVKNKKVPIETLLLQGKVLVTPYIEDIYGVQLDRRTIFKNITVLINVTFDNCDTCTCTDGMALLDLNKTGAVDTINPNKINYTVTIENTGTIEAKDILFSDKVTLGTGITGAAFVGGSFTVDGLKISGADPFTSPVDIGSICPLASVVVKYSITFTGSGTITNQAKAEYRSKACSLDKVINLSNQLTI